jgi:hypothetical protein
MLRSAPRPVMTTVRRPGAAGGCARVGGGAVATGVAGTGAGATRSAARASARRGRAASERRAGTGRRAGAGRRRRGARWSKASCQTSSSIRIASGAMDAAMRGIVLFLWLTGLADGLAPKEWRYVQNTIRPNKWVPRFL